MKTLKAWLKLNSLVLLAFIALTIVVVACVNAMIAVYGWWMIVFVIACALSVYILYDK